MVELFDLGAKTDHLGITNDVDVGMFRSLAEECSEGVAELEYGEVGVGGCGTLSFCSLLTVQLHSCLVLSLTEIVSGYLDGVL